MLEEHLRRFSRVLVLTGRRGALSSGALGDFQKIASRLGLQVSLYQGVEPNPSVETVDKVAEAAWRGGADCLVALGGGSVIDTAKLASVVAVCGCAARDYLEGRCSPCGSLPVIAVNLTHGTGSEVDRYSVISDNSSRVKLGLASDYFYPMVSVDDPTYTLTMPREQIVYTSLDALYHFIEASTSRASSPMVTTLASEGVKLIARYLPRALNKPEDVEARYWLMYAALTAGIAIDNARTHVIHVLEHVLTGLNQSLAHGAGLAILGPAAIKHICSEALETCSSILQPLLEPGESGDNPEVFARALARFQESLGFAESLRSYGFSTDHAEEVVERALELFPVQLSLSPVAVSRELLKSIYLESLDSSRQAT